MAAVPVKSSTAAKRVALVNRVPKCLEHTKKSDFFWKCPKKVLPLQRKIREYMSNIPTLKESETSMSQDVILKREI